jgi:hypothetical protein
MMRAVKPGKTAIARIEAGAPETEAQRVDGVVEIRYNAFKPALHGSQVMTVHEGV